MDVIEAIHGRRSVRTFIDKDVSETILNQLLSSAIMAPSAGNRQSWEFIIVRELETKKALVRAALNQQFIASAPVVIVVCAHQHRSAQRYGTRGGELYCIQDTAAAIQNLLLVAYSLDLGTCWVGAFKESDVSETLEIPEGVRPIALIPVGYTTRDPSPPSRILLERVLHYERY